MATDKKRGKIFTKHAKLIAVAARNGGDPDMNPTLRMAIENARAENMPFDNIERAIKKGTGEAKDTAQIAEVMYEGFGPGGTALYIETLTDNKNRTISNLKAIIGKKGGTMGAAGSVGYLFQKKGQIVLPVAGKTKEELELLAIEAGAEDITMEDEDFLEVYTNPQDLMQVKTALEKSGIQPDSARLTYVPQTEVDIRDEETARNILALIDAIEEDEDVSTVYGNFKISPEVLEKLDE